MDCKSPKAQMTSGGVGPDGPPTNAAQDDVLSFVATGNAVPLLHEIKHALARLIDGGETAIIDLGAIPFAPGDERQLDEALGDGEVHAVLNALGESHVRETAIPGVWRVDHLDEDGEIASRFIEVTTMPEILKTQREDAERGLETLSDHLSALENK